MGRSHASSTGPAPGPIGRGPADKGAELAEGVTSISDSVKEGIQQMAELHRTSALGMRQMMNATEGLKQATFEGAVIASGQALPDSVERNIGASSSGGGSITVKPAPAPNESVEKNKSIAVQSVAGLVGALVNLGWLSYFGTDAPTEVYAAVPIVVQLLAQGLATFVNNRPTK